VAKVSVACEWKKEKKAVGNGVVAMLSGAV